MQILLHGGYSGHFEGWLRDTALFRRLAEAGKQAGNKLLVAYLGYPQSVEDMETFNAGVRQFNPELEIEVALQSSVDELDNQLKAHKAIFFQGGATRKLLEIMLPRINLLKEGKVFLGGSSAGGDLLCAYGFTSSNGPAAVACSGIVQAGFMPHCSSWPIEEYLPIMRAKTDLPILMLNEGEMLEVAA